MCRFCSDHNGISGHKYREIRQLALSWFMQVQMQPQQTLISINSAPCAKCVPSFVAGAIIFNHQGNKNGFNLWKCFHLSTCNCCYCYCWYQFVTMRQRSVSFIVKCFISYILISAIVRTYRMMQITNNLYIRLWQ